MRLRKKPSPGSEVVVWRDLHQLTRKVCTHFGLPVPVLQPLANDNARLWGDCTTGRGRRPIVRLRVHRLTSLTPAGNRRRTLQSLNFGTLVNTLAHELGHLPHGREHGEVHTALAKRIRAYCIEIGACTRSGTAQRFFHARRRGTGTHRSRS